jgi:glycosyltransferase involved in cell wall biosynthesis
LKIGFDAKRAFQNNTGLGHYSRTLITSLATYFKENEYYLFAPKKISLFDTHSFSNIKTITPTLFFDKLFKSAWRSSGIKKDLLNNKIELFHGLSHEIPFGIKRTGIPSVVTIHDLIFEKYPQQFKKIDVHIYRKKFTYACTYANHIIAISKQTKNDIVELYKINPEKITVCYQSCNPIFEKTITDIEKQRVKEMYQLPDQFFLYVGSIIERKNLLAICKAINLLKEKNNIPLVVIGNGDKYIDTVKKYIAENDLTDKIILLSETEAARTSANFKSAVDFPAIYQMATALIYPSIYEGFGIPVLEALWSRLPVITSNLSCLPETGGDAAYYVNPYNENNIAEAMYTIATNISLRNEMGIKGLQHAQNFTQQKCAANVMEVYKKVLTQ